MEETINKYFKIFLNAIPYVLLAVFLFLTVFILFGMENALLGMVFLFLSKALLYSSLSKVNYTKYGLLLVGIAAMASFATFNTFTSVTLNFIVLFFITYVYSDEFAPKNHFLLGLEFVLLQIFPVTLEQIPMRMLAVVYCFVVVTIFVAIMKKFQKTSAINPFVSKSYTWVLNHLKNIKKTKPEDINVSEVYALTSGYCSAIHSNVINQDGILNNSEKFNFRLLMHSEALAQLIYDISKHQDKFTKKDYKFFSELAKTFEKTKTYEDLKDYLARLIQKHELSDAYFNNDWRLVLSSLIKTLACTEALKNTETSLLRGYRFRWESLKRRFGFKHQSFRFALQTSILVAASFLVADLLKIIDSYWIAITAYTTISMYPDDTLKDTGVRILGTIAGLLIFASITQFLPDSIRLLVVLLVGFTMMMCTKSVFINMVMGTQMAVAAIYPDLGLTWSMLLRVTFVIIGSIIVIFGVRFILHTRKQDAFKSKISELINNNKQLIFELKNILNHRMKGSYTDEALMTTHLIIDELNKLKENQELIEKESVSKLLNYNYRFIMDINRMATLLSKKEISDEEFEMLKEEINKLDDLLAGEVDLKTIPKSIYQIKDNSDSYMEFQIRKSHLTMGKFMKRLKQSKKIKTNES